MAWIRRVRTASGATAVQIAEYVEGRWQIIAHVGSAHTDAELGLLLEQTRTLRSATILSNGAEQNIAPVVPEEQQALLDTISQRHLRH